MLQRMLGHKSAKITLDIYSDLFGDDSDAGALCPALALAGREGHRH